MKAIIHSLGNSSDLKLSLIALIYLSAFFLIMKCKICSVVCSSINEYVKHCRIHMKRSNHLQIPCDSCSLVFSSRTSFFNHHTVHTGTKKQKTAVMAVLICSHCQGKFFSYKLFREHVKSLYPKTTFDYCPMCQKKDFGSFAAFNVHFWRNHKSFVIKIHNTS